jgi:hypothetical protein
MNEQTKRVVNEWMDSLSDDIKQNALRLIANGEAERNSAGAYPAWLIDLADKFEEYVQATGKCIDEAYLPSEIIDRFITRLVGWG